MSLINWDTTIVNFISLENLAKLFRPKNALLSKVLEISIDDLNFISYPCPCQGLSYDDMNLSNIPANEAGALNGGGALGVLGSPMGLPASQNGSCNSGEVITMFNVIITSVSCKAMRKINPDFAFKCQYKFASTPGADPIASALGLRAQSYGICRETIRRYGMLYYLSKLMACVGNRSRGHVMFSFSKIGGDSSGFAAAARAVLPVCH